MKLNLHEIISLFTCILLLFLGFVFIVYRHGNKNSNRLLATFLMSNATILIGQLFLSFVYPAFRSEYTCISMITQFSYLLLPPLLFLYILSLDYNNFKFRINYLLHFTPFIVFGFALVSIYFVSLFFIISEEDAYAFVNKIYQVVFHPVIFIYLLLSFRTVKQHQNRTVSAPFSKPVIDISWIKIILYSFALMWLLDLTNAFINAAGIQLPDLSYKLFIMSLLINFLFCILLVYKGISSSGANYGLSKVPKYPGDDLQFEDYQAILRNILNFMGKEKPYFDSDLTIDKLAKLISISYKQLSQTIHICLNQSFNDFINTYRINEAKRLLSSRQHANKTIFEILLTSGFNTKSVFYKTFKEKTGLNPKEYKKRFELENEGSAEK